MTRFKLDENVPARAAEPLRASGHNVTTVLEQGLGGAVDADQRTAGALPTRPGDVVMPGSGK